MILIGLLVIIAIISWEVFSFRNQSPNTTPMSSTTTGETRTALFAGGCFWCVEADFEKLSGIVGVVSGYAGGTTENPTYENYAEGGHREVVEVTYDPSKTTYESLVEHIIRYSDPTDATGSFNDRGVQYAPAIYYDIDEEKEIAQKIIAKIDAEGVYEKPITIVVIPRVKFWPAEEYHQDYSKKNPIRYNFYRNNSGRSDFIEQHKDKGINKKSSTPTTPPIDTAGSMNFENYQKPSEENLKQKLTPLQFKVTQEEGTEPPFDNEYNANKADGIYIDRISGEPLFSSKDKYDSGTGWPSFVKPIDPIDVTLHEDKGLFTTRVEVRSHYADSHLGHVFDDGPQDRGGKRYCMNSAALLFISKEEMEAKGYGRYLSLFE
jgi:peptide methionine sulfoxide reductase msrA/msrB